MITEKEFEEHCGSHDCKKCGYNDLCLLLTVPLNPAEDHYKEKYSAIVSHYRKEKLAKLLKD